MKAPFGIHELTPLWVHFFFPFFSFSKFPVPGAGWKKKAVENGSLTERRFRGCSSSNATPKTTDLKPALAAAHAECCTEPVAAPKGPRVVSFSGRHRRNQAQ
jgi:hypothetical protein